MEWYHITILAFSVIGGISSFYNAFVIQRPWRNDYLRDRSEPRDYVSDDASQKEII